MFLFFFQAEDGIRDLTVTGVQTCALPISMRNSHGPNGRRGSYWSSFTSADSNASCAASSASSGSPRTARATRRATPAYRSASTPNAARSPARIRATSPASSCSGIRAAGSGGWESGFIGAFSRAAPPLDRVEGEAECQPERTYRERDAHHPRSEEHTSELQSQSNLVCRLLLEKKKKQTCEY